ncbi:MAG: serine acetyltransferase [Cyclobacteriaceae bacterium]|nr:serine acetyltransferase [Cyclobacteriaceae bacterium]
MEKAFLAHLYKTHEECPRCPSPEVVSSFFIELLGTLFPDFSKMNFNSIKEFELHMEKLKLQLDQILNRNPVKGNVDAEEATERFFNALPGIYDKLNEDIDAMFEGDPAAKSRSEVVRTYPGFYAVAAYRFAHELYKLGIKIVPRIITEHAHSKTGIDIHPGARIGNHFCIDHGTGVVIGETTVIGNNVKLYQGVTLGALSISKEDAEKQRHPTIEDNVVIYAGATILGGETIIGKNSVIGGNVWITKSLPPNTKIYYQARMHNKDTDETDVIIYKEHL